MSFLGLFQFTAPYLPWVFLLFSLMLSYSATVDLLGIVAGHTYYYLEDVYPAMTGRRLLRTPGFLKRLFHEHEDAVAPVVVAGAAADDALFAGLDDDNEEEDEAENNNQ